MRSQRSGKKFLSRAAALIVTLLVLMALCLAGCVGENESAGHGDDAGTKETVSVEEDGTYDSKEDVAEYLSIYKKLPKNYITKNEARKLGWRGGYLEPYAPGKTIGGDRFGNREKKLPNKSGRKYYECDIDTLGAKKRGPKRMIYSNDGLIYYTEDHYNNFEKMPESA